MRAALPAIVLAASLSAAWPAIGQPAIKSLTGVIEGHEVGGVSVDMTGVIYAADFGDIVWRITPEGERSVFARGLYGTAGNAIDAKGNLIQASYYADEVVRIDRTGHIASLAATGLRRPAGIAVERTTGSIFVTNCGSNSVSQIAPDGTVSTFATSDLFNCPYGVALDRSANLYVANYNDNRVIKVTPAGSAALFATVSDRSLSHLCFKNDRLYVAAFRAHALYSISLEGVVTRLLGNGSPAVVDGKGGNARLSFPFGIGCHPWAPRLYVNEEPNAAEGMIPRRSIVRIIELDR